MKRVFCCLLSLTMVAMTFTMYESSVEAGTVKKDGYYYTLAQQKTPKAAVRINYGKLYLKKLSIKGKKLVEYGNFDYTIKMNKREWKRLRPEKRVFIISKKCKFVDHSSKVSKRKFFKELKGLSKALDSCVCLLIRVKNKKVIEMKFDFPKKHRY